MTGTADRRTWRELHGAVDGRLAMESCLGRLDVLFEGELEERLASGPHVD